MTRLRVFALTSLAMLAFAGNSLLCRLALKETSIDAASFTTIRLLSGAAMLWLVVRIRNDKRQGAGAFASALALFAYAAGFSFAYIHLSVATGALLLFGAVQATMIGVGMWKGERLHGQQIVGLLLAIGGLIGLLLPGLSAPPLGSAALMLGAGVAWGVYSLRGRGAGDPTVVTAGNFLLAAPVTLIASLFFANEMSIDRAGVSYAVASGALTSGLGYVDLVRRAASAQHDHRGCRAVVRTRHRDDRRARVPERACDRSRHVDLGRHPRRHRTRGSRSKARLKARLLT